LKQIVLASSSRYRAQLLERLLLPFKALAPDCDEAPLSGETCAETAQRLAEAKARTGGTKSGLTVGVVIGSDQVADLDGTILGKPGTTERAIAQLQAMRGRTIVFHTALALLDLESQRLQQAVVPTTVRIRNYTDQAIHYYLAHENALDCAGSAKSEGLGAALIQSMQSDDPSALIGLPLLTLVSMLAQEGIEVLR